MANSENLSVMGALGIGVLTTGVMMLALSDCGAITGTVLLGAWALKGLGVTTAASSAASFSTGFGLLSSGIGATIGICSRTPADEVRSSGVPSPAS